MLFGATIPGQGVRAATLTYIIIIDRKIDLL
jgi:hypothetical protein